jgi:hypothetical protein
MGSVMDHPAENDARTPRERSYRMWFRKAFAEPAESARMRISVLWRWASGIWAMAGS